MPAFRKPPCPRRRRSFQLRARAVLPLALLLASTGCDDSPTETEGLCVAVVNVQGTLYTSVETPVNVEPEAVSSEPFLEVTLNTGCLDQGQPQRQLASGESNFLEPGTTLHSVAGIPATERLVFWSEVVEEWLPLGPIGGQ